MKKKVLIGSTNFSTYCQKAKKLLEDNGFEIDENMLGRPLEFDDLKDKVSDIGAVIAGVDVWGEDLFKLAPELKVVTRFGVGIDNFDLEAAKKHGIKMCHARAMNANSVAESAVAMILNAMKDIPRLTDVLRDDGAWERFVGHEITGKKVGLLGFGAIAQATARMLGGFNAELYAYDKYPNMEKAKELNVTMTDMDTILKTCDVISVHLPSLPETHHIINKDTLAKMKDGVYFVNTARGALVNEADLLEALNSGKIAGAALDVYEVEPTPKSNPLLSHPRVSCTPHTAAETYETYDRVSLCCARQILAVEKGEDPEFWLNP